MMTEETVRDLLALERDGCQLEAALSDLLGRLHKLKVHQAGAAARDVRRIRQDLRKAFARLDGSITTAVELSVYLGAAEVPF